VPPLRSARPQSTLCPPFPAGQVGSGGIGSHEGEEDRRALPHRPEARRPRLRERHDIEPLDAEDNLEAIRTTLRRAYGKYASADWIANLTGGTKPMSIAIYEFFKALEGRLVYTNVAKPAVLLDIATQQTETCQHSLTIKEFLAGYGFESRKADNKIQEPKTVPGSGGSVPGDRGTCQLGGSAPSVRPGPKESS